MMSGGEIWGWGDLERFGRIAGITPETVDIDLTGEALAPRLHALGSTPTPRRATSFVIEHCQELSASPDRT